jgi:predicted DNA-binding ribbon-helix-helix protein
MKAAGNYDPRRMTTESRVRKRSIDLHGQKTSTSLEDEFWRAFREIAATQNEPVSSLITAIDRERPHGTNLSSAIRLFVLRHFRPHGVAGSRV